MRLKTRSLIPVIAVSLLVGGGLGAYGADWFPWGGSKSETQPTPAPPPPATPAVAPAPASVATGLPSFAPIATRAEAAVVNISTTYEIKETSARRRGGQQGGGDEGDDSVDRLRRFFGFPPK